MTGFRHILFPVDFSERSKAVASYVTAFAQQFQARVTILNVVQIPPGMPGGVDPSYPVMFDYESLEAQVREVLKEYGEGSAVERVVRVGEPAIDIADFAKEHAVDLIMLPTHGYGKFRSLLLGSVTSKVLHDFEGAVWTAPHAENLALSQHWPCRQVLVAVDRGAEPVVVLRRAVDLARDLGAEIRIVHAVPAAEVQAGETGGEEFSNFLMKMAEQDMVKLQAEAGTNCEASVVAGGIGAVVRQVAEEQRADLVVIGRGVMHATFGRLRSKSYEIIRLSPCPVLSL